MDYGIIGTEISPFASADFCYWLIIAASAVLMFLLISLHVTALSKTSFVFLKLELSFKHIQPFDEIAQNYKFNKLRYIIIFFGMGNYKNHYSYTCSFPVKFNSEN